MNTDTGAAATTSGQVSQQAVVRSKPRPPGVPVLRPDPKRTRPSRAPGSLIAAPKPMASQVPPPQKVALDSTHTAVGGVVARGHRRR